MIIFRINKNIKRVFSGLMDKKKETYQTFQFFSLFMEFFLSLTSIYGNLTLRNYFGDFFWWTVNCDETFLNE